MAGADFFAIMKAMGHADIKTTMIYVSLGKSHIREQVERLNAIQLAPTNYKASSNERNNPAISGTESSGGATPLNSTLCLLLLLLFAPSPS